MKFWKTEIAWLAAIVAAVTLAQAIFDLGWLAAVTGIAAYAVRNLYMVYWLSRRLRDRRRIEPPFPAGPWAELLGQIRLLQVRNRKRKRRLTRFISRFREVAAALPDAVVTLRANDEVEWFNPAAERYLGLRESRDAGTPIATLLHDPVFDEYLRSREFSHPLEIRCPTDPAVILSLAITPFGRKRQRLLVARDITRVYYLDQARRDFVANVSHELRTPLTVISGYLETLSTVRPDTPEARRSVTTMREQADRMQQLIDELLVLSRLEMNDRPPAAGAVDVSELLTSIVQQARDLSGAGEHVLRLDVESGLRLRGSEPELRSAFSNLIFNAVRHTPARSEIHVRGFQGKDGAHITVRDTGEGIAARHIARLTERFYRVDDGRASATGGTGLGLAIVKQVLNRHDGTLGIASQVGQGTTFSCHFPRASIVRAVAPDPEVA